MSFSSLVSSRYSVSSWVLTWPSTGSMSISLNTSCKGVFVGLVYKGDRYKVYVNIFPGPVLCPLNGGVPSIEVSQKRSSTAATFYQPLMAKLRVNSVTWYSFTFAVSRKQDSSSLTSSKSTLKGKVGECSSLQMQPSLHANRSYGRLVKCPSSNAISTVIIHSKYLSASDGLRSLNWSKQRQSGMQIINVIFVDYIEGVQRATALFCKSDYHYTSSVSIMLDSFGLETLETRKKS